MNPQAGLSFEQAPPFSLPLRFFLTAPLFLLASGGLIVLMPEALSTRWTPQALALTHALTLGFLAMVMTGALMQMLPVVAGVTLPLPRLVARIAHLGLTAGCIALMAGFLASEPIGFTLAIAMLGLALITFMTAAAASLLRATSGATVNGMRLALISLAFTVALGGALAWMRSGHGVLPAWEAMRAAHVAFGLQGWVLLLVIAAAYQVVPMFQITPPYPKPLSRWFAGFMFALLLIQAAATGEAHATTRLVEAGLAAGVLAFALITLRLQSRRKRKLPDVALDFWRLGMISLIACVLAWSAAQLHPQWGSAETYPLVLGVLFIGGFAVSVVNGMLYKIVPFLAWFHLQSQSGARAGSIPTMKNMIGERAARRQFQIHSLAIAGLAAAVFFPSLAIPAGMTLGLSALFLWWNLISAMRRFTRHGGRLA